MIGRMVVLMVRHTRRDGGEPPRYCLGAPREEDEARHEHRSLGARLTYIWKGADACTEYVYGLPLLDVDGRLVLLTYFEQLVRSFVS